MQQRASRNEAHLQQWYKAFTLCERARLLKAASAIVVEEDCDQNLAKERVLRWRLQPPFQSDSQFMERLRSESLSLDEFSYILGEDAAHFALQISEPPTWLTEIEEAFSQTTAQSSHDDAAVPNANHVESPGGFLNLIRPLIQRIRASLRSALGTVLVSCPHLRFEAAALEEGMFATAAASLLRILNRTMVLELHVARLRECLDGSTPTARFESFLRKLEDAEYALSILREYPVLARQLWSFLQDWHDFSLELLLHLGHDWHALLQKFFPGQDPGDLVQVSMGVGDRHRGGKSVSVLRFSSGEKLVYKPRSLKADLHFGEVIEWLNMRGLNPPLQHVNVLDCGDHGWAEFIEPSDCADVQGVHRFYQRLGMLLALLYTLDATDFHAENVIAAGEDPYLVDVEGLFQPRMELLTADTQSTLIRRLMSHSVLRVGLLPVWRRAAQDDEGLDMSGIYGRSGQPVAYAGPAIDGLGTDEMRVIRRRGVTPRLNNRPTLRAEEVDPQAYADSVVNGFKEGYGLLLQNRARFSGPDGPLERFAEDEVRAVLRPTRSYAILLNESYHPELFRSGVDRDRLFDRLWAGIEDRKCLEAVIPSERSDLHRHDIPMFTTRPGSRDLWNSSGECLPDFFAEPSLDCARCRLQDFGSADLDRQVWFIRASLATLSRGLNRDQWVRYEAAEPSGLLDRDMLLSQARLVGDRLENLALGEREGTSWIGLTLVGERLWSLSPAGVDLYAGLPGIALFLAYLGDLTGEVRYTTLARSAYGTAVDQLKQMQNTGDPNMPIGAFNGLGGMIYVCSHLGALWNDTRLLEEALDWAARIADVVAADKDLDLMSGSAGAIATMAILHDVCPRREIVGSAITCGEHLLRSAQPMTSGIGWVTSIKSSQPLTGLSHGASGFAWALFRLSRLTGDVAYRNAALEALAYERSQYLPQSRNWPDFRDESRVVMPDVGTKVKCMTAWCHGAPGIGLMRLHCLPELDAEMASAEIQAALETTLAEGFGLNHSLCHGDFGNLEVLNQAARRLDGQWEQECRQRLGVVVESIRRGGWRCGIPLGVETPGLMLGLAGIGYGLLRSAAPDRVPSILALEGPRKH
jgi:type 2 lantibiotic biosynthesis protein LanM